jgi:hypothetical protein
MPDISKDDGLKITAEAKTWKGTPYSMVGGNTMKGVKGDCSGTTHKIFEAAGFPYAFQSTSTFPDYAVTSGLFRLLDAKEARQDGDIFHWPGHMAIFCTFFKDEENRVTKREKNGKKFDQVNDMWTAFHTGGPAYGPHRSDWYKQGVTPKVYRYQKQ